MNQQLLSEYVELEEEFKLLETKKTEVRLAILTDLKNNNLDKVKSEAFGSFTIAHKTAWKYTPAVTKLEDKVKIAKDKEQKKGLARATTTEYLLYKSK